MLKRLLPYALAFSMAPIMSGALSGCGDDGGGDDPDASRPDAMQGPDGGGGADAGVDGGVDYDRSIKSIAGGRITPFEGYEDIAGAAHLVRMGEGLRAELYVEGLKESTAYVAHVHRLPCGENKAGEHYKHDPTIAAEVEANEIWLRFTTDVEGKGVASTEQLGQARIARMDAQSLVVHDPEAGDAKMACADLFFDDEPAAEIELQGAFSAFADAPAADQGIGGSVTVNVSVEAGETFVNFDLEGVDETASYIAHVHVLPCEVDKGGEHYKRDTTVASEMEDNEIWPDPDMQEQTFPHAARYDAQSIVIHRMETGKVACANLGRVTEIPEYVTEGSSLVLPGLDPQYAALDASATLTRKKDGTTEATLEVTGLPDGVADFGAHVHAGTCNLTPPGGPHYKLDPSITAEVEANEIWLDFDADAGGDASSENARPDHPARPDAISVVIHAPGSDTRLSCIELE
jgi:hypothetical protein